MDADITESILSLVESLSPVSGTEPFARIQDWPPSEEVPLAERTFWIEWEGAATRIFETGTKRFRETGTIVIHYDAAGDRVAVEKRIAEDRSLVLDALLFSDFNESVVLTTSSEDSIIEWADLRFPVARLQFTIDYRQ